MTDIPVLGERVLNFVDGAWTQSQSGKWTERYDPADQAVLVGSAPDSTREDAAAAVDAAWGALEGWSATPGPRRGRLLFDWMKWVEQRRHQLAELLTREEGTTLTESTGEVNRAI